MTNEHVGDGYKYYCSFDLVLLNFMLLLREKEIYLNPSISYPKSFCSVVSEFSKPRKGLPVNQSVICYFSAKKGSSVNDASFEEEQEEFLKSSL